MEALIGECIRGGFSVGGVTTQRAFGHALPSSPCLSSSGDEGDIESSSDEGGSESGSEDVGDLPSLQSTTPSPIVGYWSITNPAGFEGFSNPFVAIQPLLGSAVQAVEVVDAQAASFREEWFARRFGSGCEDEE
jgi:hypothetical protein